MSDFIELSSTLGAELASLNGDQRVAVTQKVSNVVRAGPGSGKTRTLVARVAYLLEVEIPRRQGVAAITYTRQAAREIDDRIGRLGLKDRHRLTCGTVHSWCMSAILRPYGPLVGFSVPLEGAVIDDNDGTWVRTLQGCFDDLGIPNNAQYERAAVTKIRRELAAGYSDERTRMVEAAELFDRKLTELGMFDFDSMISSALKIVSQHSSVGRLLASRYPWIVVDEYQDLGPVLHKLVLTLHERYGVHISAFGDPGGLFTSLI